MVRNFDGSNVVMVEGRKALSRVVATEEMKHTLINNFGTQGASFYFGVWDFFFIFANNFHQNNKLQGTVSIFLLTKGQLKEHFNNCCYYFF